MNYYNMLLVLSLSALPMLAIASEAPVSINQTAPKVEEPQEFVIGDAKLTSAQTLALAKKSQNPIANMRSFKFQNNTNVGLGPDDSTQNMLNVMPILPFKLNEDILVITRTVMPIVSQPDFLTPEDEGRINGLGDTTFSAFFSPMKSDVVWGVGPIFLLPTATDDALGQEKWGGGASAILLDQPGRWVYGGIVSNVWSMGGGGDEDVNLFTLQYFVNYNFDDGWYLFTSPIITADWEADTDHRWTLPIGLGFGKLMKIGSQAMTAQISYYNNVITPDDYGADYQIRAMLMFMFPRSG